MTAAEEGTENMEVRTKWPNEALDFTPWLAQNLNLLGEELGIRLELVQQEKAVGPMSLDILARDTDTKELVARTNWSGPIPIIWASCLPTRRDATLTSRFGWPQSSGMSMPQHCID